MPSTQRNIVANYLGSAWSALMGLAFVPLYIHFLGMEAYGLIGVVRLLQASMLLLDFGLSPMISREMARHRAGALDAQQIGDLLRSVEWIYFVVAGVIAAGLALAAPWLAQDWLHEQSLPLAVASHALALCGLAIAARWLTGLYHGAVIGLQEQVWLNGCVALFSTLRGLGAVVLLAWFTRSVEAYVVFLGVITALEVGVLLIKTRRLLPPAPRSPRFSRHALQGSWRFAVGMAAIAVLSVLLTQGDRLLLSRLLSLTDFGYYSLAASVAGVLYTIVLPVRNAIYPRLVELAARGTQAVLAEAYHRYCQLVSFVLIPASMVLALFAGHLLLLWTRDPVATAHVVPLVRLLVIGYLCNGLSALPYALQLAHGWTRLNVSINAIAVCLLLPAIWFGVSAYGAIAAPVAWAVLNASYVLISIPLMHRRLLPAEMGRWYTHDALAPVLATGIAGGAVCVLSPAPEMTAPVASLLVLCLAGTISVLAALLATPLGRELIQRWLSAPQPGRN